MSIFMKNFTLLLLNMVLYFYSAFTLAKSPKLLTSPAPNVLCDRYICADRIEGVSASLTEKYLGKIQEWPLLDWFFLKSYCLNLLDIDLRYLASLRSYLQKTFLPLLDQLCSYWLR